MRNWALATILLLIPSSLMALSDGPLMPEWLTGAWEHQAGEEWSDEYWTPPRGDMMIGASRSGKGERLLFWEHMRIVREDDGGIAFWAVTADQKPVRFDAVVSMENEIIFENAGHDYPQRIRYRREGEQLKAEISLIDGTKAKPFNWRIRKTEY